MSGQFDNLREKLDSKYKRHLDEEEINSAMRLALDFVSQLESAINEIGEENLQKVSPIQRVVRDIDR